MLVQVSRLVAVPTAGTLQSRAWRQDPRRPGKARETWPTAGQPGWACSESTCTGTTRQLEGEKKKDDLFWVKNSDSCLSLQEVCLTEQDHKELHTSKAVKNKASNNRP